MIHDSRNVVLICDTKNEIDDQLAIAYALGSSRLNVKGIISCQNTLVHGHASVDLYKEEADKILGLAGKLDIPSLRGARSPLDNRSDYQQSDGVDFMIDALEDGLDFSILATGPATDLALLQMLKPELTKNIPVIWAGSFPNQETWNQHKYGELNARADIQAWRITYETIEKLVVLPGWPGVQKVDIDSEEFVARLRTYSHPLSNYLAQITENWCSGKGFVHKKLDMDTMRARKVLWDLVNIAYYSVPNSVKCEILDLPTIDPAGSMYWDRPTRKVPVCMDVDSESILSDFWLSLTNLGVRN